MLEKIKKAIRIIDDDFNDEITDCINQCKADLELSGVHKSRILDDDLMILTAVKTYCKAEFGIDNPDRSKLIESYNSLKAHLSISYRDEKVVEEGEE